MQTKFQFHKVRLKEKENLIGFVKSKFQFHKVRLKGYANLL